jgi:hypothetical protein
VREAARASLSEFSFERYRAAFDFLANELRITAGGIVKKVDEDLSDDLRRELLSLARSRRIRAIEMTTASGIVESVEQELISNLEDEDHLVRAAAVWALGQSESEASQAALLAALADRSAAVQYAAQESLAERHRSGSAAAMHPGANR